MFIFLLFACISASFFFFCIHTKRHMVVQCERTSLEYVLKPIYIYIYRVKSCTFNGIGGGVVVEYANKSLSPSTAQPLPPRPMFRTSKIVTVNGVSQLFATLLSHLFELVFFSSGGGAAATLLFVFASFFLPFCNWHSFAYHYFCPRKRLFGVRFS